MAKSVDGLSKLITIYCGMLAMQGDCWEGIDEETRDLIAGNEDLSRMMKIAEDLGGRLKDWQPDAATLRLMGSLEKELDEITGGAAGVHSEAS